MSVAAFLPWHQQVAEQWLGNRERFAHAWLIHGLAGIGKKDFALAAAASLLCEAPVKGMACGKCLACGWVHSGNHPDLKRIRPETIALEEGAEQEAEDGLDASGETSLSTDSATSSKRAPSKEIRVEQIRALEPWFNNATHRGGWRVALIYPAETLNAISANALLKVLEEPPPNTVFLMVADAPDRLLATLLSRCRRLPLATPSLAVAHEWLIAQGVKQADGWLAASGGAPLLAKKLSAAGNQPCPEWLSNFVLKLSQSTMPDIGALADSLSKYPPVEWLDPLQRLSVDLMLVANDIPCRYFPSLTSQLKMLIGSRPSGGLSDLAGFLNDQRRIAGHPLSAKLFAHSVLQRIATVCLQTQAKKER